METGDITVTLTESQHELILNVFCHMIDSFDFVASDSLMDLPLDNPTVQKYSMLNDLKEMFAELWVDRFEPSTETF